MQLSFSSRASYMAAFALACGTAPAAGQTMPPPRVVDIAPPADRDKPVLSLRVFSRIVIDAPSHRPDPRYDLREDDKFRLPRIATSIDLGDGAQAHFRPLKVRITVPLGPGGNR